MNIVILTQALLNNYGGLLQDYALQQVLKKMGHSVLTIDFRVRNNYRPLWLVLLNRFAAIFLNLLGRKIDRYTIPRFQKRGAAADSFVKEYIDKTRCVSKYSLKLLNELNVSACVVGSDQVWRPKYNYYLEDMFLDFCRGRNLKRIAYAASFGVDGWEYTSKQTKKCSGLAQKFNAISVREESGVKLCKEYLGVEATWVLDPTLLLTKDDYLPICKEVPISTEKYLAVYVLDENEHVIAVYEKEAAMRGLEVKKFHANEKSTLTVPEWLAMFRDASCVVTDSFHGTVFSMIFGKEFKCIYNESRGSARFDSLLKLYKLGKLDEMREFSLNWLKNALES